MEKLYHENFMEEALKEAEKAYRENEVPVGAVILKNGRIISRAHNEKETLHDSTCHAEMTAIRQACRTLGTWRLENCSMYTTLEPCTMCAGAIIQARIHTLYIGTSDLKAGAAGSVIDVFRHNIFNHNIDVVWGLLQEECSQLLTRFFKEKR
jgi:tRNA(adenine34) deaminase